jgi:hypothetical protein
MPKYKPEPTIFRTPLDEIGSLINVDRIPGETLFEYSERILGAYVLRSSSTYQGLLNGINRSLGLSEDEIFTIDQKKLITGNRADSNVVVTQNSIKDETFYTGVVDGNDIIATGDTLSDSSLDLQENRLVGFTLFIDGESFPIISNSSDTIKFNGSVSAVVGETYEIYLDLEENLFSSFGLYINGESYIIDFNTSNEIFIEDGELPSSEDFSYYISALNPKVEITSAEILLYKEFESLDNFQLDIRIPIRDENFFHTEIVDRINSHSRFFTATNLKGRGQRVMSRLIKKQTSDKKENETIPSSRIFSLEHKNIKYGSVRFSEQEIFSTETSQGNVLDVKGRYNIEYSSGTVLTGETPSGDGLVSYTRKEIPFTVISSPVVVNSFSDRTVKDYLFSRIEMTTYRSELERFAPGQPTADMIELVAELLQVRRQSWSK